MSWLYKLLDPMNMSPWKILLLRQKLFIYRENIINKKDNMITIFANNKRITISFNIKIKPNGLTQDVNNIIFLYIYEWLGFS
jgi:hypothetical protein